MSRLLALTVARYRSFARPTRLELRPLTLLCGRNNAGKSALLRLLPIIADSVADNARSPLDLSGPAGRRASFLSAHYGGSAPEADEPGIELSFHWSDDAACTRIDYIIDFSREDNRTYVRELRVYGKERTVELAATAHPPVRESLYDLEWTGGGAPQVPISFVGLIPETDLDNAMLAEVRRVMSELRGRVQWLQAMRASPQRLVEASGAAPRLLGPDGQEAVDILLTNPDMQEEVADWYRRAVARDFELRPYENHYRPLLNPIQHRFDLRLIDAGEGMAQVLPVLVALAMARRHSQGWPRIVAIEEPESHLHPDAQRALAEHVCALAASPEPPSIILETHSNALMLAIRLAIARGDLPPDRVCAYWLGSREDGTSVVNPAEFNAHGNPDGNWPPNTFTDERELARELVSYQL